MEQSYPKKTEQVSSQSKCDDGDKAKAEDRETAAPGWIGSPMFIFSDDTDYE